MKFDEILIHVGEFGPYQKRTYYLLCLPALLCGAQFMSIIFTMATPLYRCQIPDYPNDTYQTETQDHAQLVNLTIPPGDDSSSSLYSECLVYSHLNDSQSASPGNANSDSQNMSSLQERGTSPCSSWVYDQTDYLKTIITEFNIVCEDRMLKSHGNMIQFAGALFGCLFMGSIADMIGRKKGIILSLVIQFVSALGVFLAPSYYVLVGFRGLAGIASHSLFSISASMGIELVGPNKRTYTGMVVNFYWAVGVLLVLPVSYLIRDWRYIQLFLCLLTVPLLSLWWLIPESPRWLLDKNRFAETKEIMEKICRANKTVLPPGSINAETADDGPQGKIWDMFSHRVLFVRTLVIFFNWLAVNLLYYGLSLNLDNLAGSIYINFLIGALVEVVAYIMCLLLLNRIGRRKFHCVCMFCGAASCLAVIIPMTLTNKDTRWVTTLLAMIGKLCASACYAVLYIMSAELFPTVIRNLAIGCCSIFENLGGMLAPYIADMGELIGGPFSQGLPMLVFGGVSIVAAILSLSLPETLHRALPETVQDAIDFGRSVSFNPSSSSNTLPDGVGDYAPPTLSISHPGDDISGSPPPQP